MAYSGWLPSARVGIFTAIVDTARQCSCPNPVMATDGDSGPDAVRCLFCSRPAAEFGISLDLVAAA